MLYHLLMEGKIALIVGSKSDIHYIEDVLHFLEDKRIPYEVEVLSAHRNLEELVSYVSGFEERNVKVVIACAGLSAALPGIVSSLTNTPVIGVPLDVGPLKGVDALLSMVQMPKGNPVAVTSIGKAGIYNSLLLAFRILGLLDRKYLKLIDEFKASIRG